MDSVLVASPPRRHVFAKGARRSTRTNKMEPTSLSPSVKRTACESDENNVVCAPGKKSKSGNMFSTGNKLAVFSKHHSQRPTKRGFGIDVTNTFVSGQENTKPSLGEKGLGGKLPGLGERQILKPRSIINRITPPSSPVKKLPTATSTASSRQYQQPLRRPPSPRIGSGRGARLSPPRHHHRRISRIDPPFSLPSSSSSIAALLSRPIKSSLLSLSSTTTSATDSTTASTTASTPLTSKLPIVPTASSIPDSWTFTIHEDTPDETLQNTLQHCTTTLDISDVSDDEGSVLDEVEERGKENISPEQMADILRLAEEERRLGGVRLQMQRDTTEKRERKQRREALREMSPEEFESADMAVLADGAMEAPEKEEPKGEKEEKEGEQKEKSLPTISAAEFPRFGTPEGVKEWTVWESMRENETSPVMESYRGKRVCHSV